MSVISPINIIQEEINSGSLNRYLQMGDSCMVRKFDPTLITSGSWKELWLGFKWRINLGYVWDTVVDPINDSGRLMFGVCDTTGYVYGQSGSFVGSNTQLKHYVGFEYGISRAMDWSIGHSGSYYYMYIHSQPILWATGSRILGPLSTANTTVVISANSLTEPIDSLCIFRIYTGSIGTDGVNKWNMSVMAPLTSSMYYNYPNSWLGELLKQPSWNQLTASLPVSYSVYTPLVSTNNLPINQSVNGYFDGIFMAWNSRYNLLTVSDVAVRAIY
jgi:hypothetical protein